MASGKSQSKNNKQTFPCKRGRNRNIFISTFFILGLFLFFSCHSETEGEAYVLPAGLKPQSGDLVFRTGQSLASKTVTCTDEASIYSHVGIILWTDNGWQVLHAVPNERANDQEKDSVKLEPLSVFFRSDRALQGGVYRLPLSSDDTAKILRKSLDIYQRHPLFDSYFNDQDSSAFYCTELVWFIFKSELGIDLSQGKRHRVPVFPDLIFCSDILGYPELKEIMKF